MQKYNSSGDEFITMNMEVSYNSYAENKCITELPVPPDCEITEVIRNHKYNVPIDDGSLLQLGDVVVIKLKQKDYEKLFGVFRSMTNE